MDATVTTALSGWENFFIAAAGAAGALAGLVFVALSINLAKILESKETTGRAAETMLMLGAALFGALLSLLPGRSVTSVGAVALCIWLPILAFPLRAQIRLARAHNYYRWSFFIVRVTLHQVATLPFLIGGILFYWPVTPKASSGSRRA